MLLCGKFCRLIYRGLTIPAQASRYSGTDLISVGTHRDAHLRAEWNCIGGGADGCSPCCGGLIYGQRPGGALIALQGVEDPTERKKRAVAKGRNALDVLDSLKLGLIDGSVDQSTVARLRVAAEGLTDTSGDTGLDGVLGEIDLRVAVELAKAGVR